MDIFGLDSWVDFYKNLGYNSLFLAPISYSSDVNSYASWLEPILFIAERETCGYNELVRSGEVTYFVHPLK